MDTLMEQFGEAIGAFVEHPIVRLTVTGASIYIVILWLASAFWAFHDLRRRHRDPVLPYVAAAAIIFVSPILFPLAVFVYRIVRPAETLAESRERQLNDRLIEIETSEALRCPGCGLAVEEDWLACPACRTRLAHRCRSCHRSMGLDWAVCAWCGTEFGWPVIADPLPAPARPVGKRAAVPEPHVEVARA